MKILFYSIKSFEKKFFEDANSTSNHHITFIKDVITTENVEKAKGYDAICISVRDTVTSQILKKLAMIGIKSIALRSAGYDHVDVQKAKELGLSVTYVPQYSPYSIAEHAVTLMLSLNRKIVDASERNHLFNFTLDGLLGFDMHGKTVGIIGTGRIGLLTAKILQGFGCSVIAYDVYQNPECNKLGIPYVSLQQLFKTADIISLHCPLTKETEYIINDKAINAMKNNVMIINTARGKLINTKALVQGLESKKIGYVGLDVYENEKNTFFEDKSQNFNDPLLKRLLLFPNVLVTAHQAWFTQEANTAIAQTVLQNLTAIEQHKNPQNSL